MPRTQDSDLTTIFQAYKRRDYLDIYLNDSTVVHLSRGAVTRTIAGVPTVYNNWIRSVGDLSSTIDQSIDHISVVGQNVSSVLGLDLASNLRLMDYAIVEYGKQYQSLIDAEFQLDIKLFAGVLANAEADLEHFSMEMIVDYESLGSVIANRGMGPLCWFLYKNGIECTSASGLTSCPKTRTACVTRGVEHQMGGWEFFEQPASSPPGSGGDGGGGVGGGDDGGDIPCFTLDTNIWLPSGEVSFGELPLGKPSERIPLVSFDKLTGEIDYDDEIVEVFEHEVVGYFTFEYDDGRTLPPTCNHRIWQGFGKFKQADDFRINDRMKVFTDRWSSPRLKKIKWNSDAKVKVRNLHAKKNHTYFANRTAVSNVKIFQ
jgi:hypothetical protein